MNAHRRPRPWPHVCGTVLVDDATTSDVCFAAPKPTTTSDAVTVLRLLPSLAPGWEAVGSANAIPPDNRPGFAGAGIPVTAPVADGVWRRPTVIRGSLKCVPLDG